MSTFKSGDVLLIGAACSVQFAGDRALRLRLVSVDQRPTYHGWVWLTGYVLNDKGLAVENVRCTCGGPECGCYVPPLRPRPVGRRGRLPSRTCAKIAAPPGCRSPRSAGQPLVGARLTTGDAVGPRWVRCCSKISDKGRLTS